MKYRKKPVVVEARQFLPDAGGDVVAWCNSDNVFLGFEPNAPGGGEHILIETLEGDMRANPGDWIVRGVRGELYPVKPDIFAETYEPVETA